MPVTVAVVTVVVVSGLCRILAVILEEVRTGGLTGPGRNHDRGTGGGCHRQVLWKPEL